MDPEIDSAAVDRGSNALLSWVRAVRTLAWIASCGLSVWAGGAVLTMPSEYYMPTGYDPASSSQGRLALLLLVFAAITLAVGLGATGWLNAKQKGDPGYSPTEALYGVIVPAFLFALALGAWLNV